MFCRWKHNFLIPFLIPQNFKLKTVLVPLYLNTALSILFEWRFLRWLLWWDFVSVMVIWLKCTSGNTFSQSAYPNHKVKAILACFAYFFFLLMADSFEQTRAFIPFGSILLSDVDIETGTLQCFLKYFLTKKKKKTEE